MGKDFEMDKIEKELTNILENASWAVMSKLVKDWESEDFLKLSPQIKSFYNLVRYLHGKIESQLETIIENHIFGIRDQKSLGSVVEAARRVLKLNPIFRKLEFYAKLDICCEIEPRLSKIKNKLIYLNVIRNLLSHPVSNRMQIASELGSEPKREKALQKIVTTYLIFKKHFIF